VWLGTPDSIKKKTKTIYGTCPHLKTENIPSKLVPQTERKSLLNSPTSALAPALQRGRQAAPRPEPPRWRRQP